MKLIQLEFETLKDRNEFLKQKHKIIKYYRLYVRNNKYYIEFGQDK